MGEVREPADSIEARYEAFRYRLVSAVSELRHAQSMLAKAQAAIGSEWARGQEEDVRGVAGYWARQVERERLRLGLVRLGLNWQDVLDALAALGLNPAYASMPVLWLGTMRRLSKTAGADWSTLRPELKLGPGQRWRLPTDEEWRTGGGRELGFQRWGLIGDYLLKLHDLIAPKIPPVRKRGRVIVHTNTYNQAAAAFAARIVNHQFGNMISKPVTAAGVKSRLKARGRRAPRQNTE